MHTLWSEIALAWRNCRAHPGLTVVAVLSLAIGIGPNAALFSVIDAFALRPRPIREANQLVALSNMAPRKGNVQFSYAEYEDVRAGVRAFSNAAFSRLIFFAARVGNQQATAVVGAVVSPNYFTTLGVDPLLGRSFTAEDDRAGRTRPTAMISEHFWTTAFGRDPGILRRTVRLNQVECGILGVVPARFTGTLAYMNMDVWVSAGAMGAVVPSQASFTTARSLGGGDIYARLAPGATLERAGAELDALSRHLAEAYPDTNRDSRFTAAYEARARRLAAAPLSAVSLAVVGLLLLVACANVAGLMLGRAEARRSEIVTRLALGATRGRLIRQLLTESAVIALLGAGVGLLFAWWFMTMVPALVPATQLPIALDLRLDWRMLAFTLFAGLVSAPVFGLTPALLASRPDLMGVLKGGQSRDGGRWRAFNPRTALVVGQIAVSLAFLVASGLLIRSLVNQDAVDLGFTPRPMAFALTAPTNAGYDAAATAGYYERILQRLKASPGVERATIVARMPLEGLYGGGARVEATIPGQRPPMGQDAFSLRYNVTGPDYFETIGIAVLQGRAFTPWDRADSSRVIVVNQTMAKQFWPAGDAVGQRVSIAMKKGQPSQVCEVVGVVRDSKYHGIRETPEPYVYLPYAQTPPAGMAVAVAGGDEAHLARVLRQELLAVDRAVPTLQVTTLSAQIKVATLPERLASQVVSSVGGVALFLSVIGLYGVIAFQVARRTRDLAIRMALGARPGDLVRSVLGHAARLAAAGTVLGVVLAGMAANLMRAGLVGVDRFDPLTYIAASGITVFVALAASYLPARRASRIDPLVALRE